MFCFATKPLLTISTYFKLVGALGNKPQLKVTFKTFKWHVSVENTGGVVASDPGFQSLGRGFHSRSCITGFFHSKSYQQEEMDGVYSKTGHTIAKQKYYNSINTLDC